MDKVRERLERAQAAEALLGNELIKNLLLAYKERFTREWIETNAEEAEQRELIYAQYRGLLSLISDLKSFIVDGNVIRHEQKQGEIDG